MLIWKDISWYWSDVELAYRTLCHCWSQVLQWLFHCHLLLWSTANIHSLSGPTWESKCMERKSRLNHTTSIELKDLKPKCQSRSLHINMRSVTGYLFCTGKMHVSAGVSKLTRIQIIHPWELMDNDTNGWVPCCKPNFTCRVIKMELSWTEWKLGLVLMVLPSSGPQVSHDMHGLHGIVHHMTVPHKILCGLPVDYLWFRDTAIPTKYARHDQSHIKSPVWLKINKLQSFLMKCDPNSTALTQLTACTVHHKGRKYFHYFFRQKVSHILRIDNQHTDFSVEDDLDYHSILVSELVFHLHASVLSSVSHTGHPFSQEGGAGFGCGQ